MKLLATSEMVYGSSPGDMFLSRPAAFAASGIGGGIVRHGACFSNTVHRVLSNKSCNCWFQRVLRKNAFKAR